MVAYLSPKVFRIFAHRGSTEGGAVENTLEAFRFAVDSGVKYLETDVQATKDGVAVLFHDKTLERLTGIAKRVNQFTFAELSKLKLQGVSRILSLQEALERLPDSKFNLDLKTFDAIAPTVEVIAKTQSSQRVLVSSFSSSRRHKALLGLPQVATSADAKLILLLWFAYKIRARDWYKNLVANVNALQIPTRIGFLRFDQAEFISLNKQFGVEVHYWTINDIDQARQLANLGADGIVTDKGKMMVERFLRGERGK